MALSRCRIRKCAGCLAHFLFVCSTLGVSAAGPVGESIGTDNEREDQYASEPRSTEVGTGRQIAPEEEPVNLGQLTQLFYQLQLIQQEMQLLRGTMEEQQYRLDRMTREQQKRYVGLDKRIGELQGQAPAGLTEEPIVNFGVSRGVEATERDVYESAYAMMRRQEFEQAVLAFDTLIIDYPNGQYTPNAFYWLGELHLRNKALERSRQSFVQVTMLYPKHNKMPDSLYKLGVVYTELGDEVKAMEYLNRVMREYPRSTSANLAKSYVVELQ
jgi:tol-pal system protein YbgF